MNIGHFMPGIWDVGGIGIYIRRVAAAQRACGHTVRFFDCLETYASLPDVDHRPEIVAPRNLAARARAQGLDVLHLHASMEPMPEDGPPLVRTLHDHRPYCPSGERYLKRSGTPCNRVYGTARCVWGHVFDRCGSIRPPALLQNFAATRRERRTLPGHTLVAISRYVRDQMVLSGFDGAQIHVLHNPAPTPRPYTCPPREGIPRFLFLGRLSVHKGLQWLLRCLPQIAVPIALDIAGDGPQRAEMEELVARTGLGDRVTFHGWINEGQIDELAAKARAIVFPVVWHEPAGLVTLDASARGRAVIGSRTGGIPEFAIEGRNALLVEPNDDLGLVEAMTRLAEDWELARRLGEGGLELASGPFSLERHRQALDLIYEGLVRSASDRPSRVAGV
jgi:glycosyltransferase involved in cell wall biosynthesis